eukprot:2832571-Rhodomonas_salina.2
MKTGGLRMLHIPPALAYGKKGNAKIPGITALSRLSFVTSSASSRSLPRFVRVSYSPRSRHE